MSNFPKDPKPQFENYHKPLTSERMVANKRAVSEMVELIKKNKELQDKYPQN